MYYTIDYPTPSVAFAQIDSKAPRFQAIYWSPIYGSRDEIVGERGTYGAAAETRGWLDAQIARDVPDEWTDIRVSVEDREPWKDAANWGPKLPRGWWVDAETGALELDDLPF